MRRLSLSFLVLTFSLVGVAIAPQQSVAAPLPAAFSGAAGGDEVAIDLDVTDVNATDLADARFAVTQSTAVGGTTPTSTARASNLAATLAGVGITLQSESQTAPPDNPTADSGTILAQSEPGLLDLGLLTTSVQARTEAAIACAPGGGVIANSQIQSAGSTVDPTGVGTVVDSDDSTTNGFVGIFPEPLSHPLNRAILSVATGSISGTSFLDGAIEVDIAGNSTLQAFATGEPGGATVTYNPGAVTVTVGGTTTTVAPSGTQPFDLAGGQVIVTANELTTVTESADGQTAARARSPSSPPRSASGQPARPRPRPLSTCCRSGPQPFCPPGGSTARRPHRS